MSQENVEIVRRANDLLNRANWQGLASLCDADVEFRDLGSAVDTAEVLHGADAFMTLARDWAEAWSTFGAEILGYADPGPYVFCDVRWYGTGRGSDVTVDVRQTDAYELQEAKIVRVTLAYSDRAAALRDFGLAE